MNIHQTKSHNVLWFFICLGILALGFASFVLLRSLKPAPEQRPQSTFLPLVQTTPLQYRQSPLLVQGSGSISPAAEISLSSQVSGEIINTHDNLVTGGYFIAGEIMAQIDARSYAANLAEAEANKAASLSSLTFINKQIERQRSLRAEGYSPEESLDDAISRRDQTLATIARQDALIEIRQLELERTSIKAPFSGRILSENIDKGDIVSVGRELARFYDSAEFEVVVSLNADDASFIPGLWNNNNAEQQQAWVNVEHGGRIYQWPGYLSRVEADIDSATRTVDVVIKIPNPSQPGELVSSKNGSSIAIDSPPLLIGMYASVEIEGLRLPQHFVLAINTIHNNNTIWVVDSEGRLSIEPIEFVRAEGNQAVILAPQLAPGTLIITNDIALVSDGMRINVQGQPLPTTGSTNQ